MSCQNESPSQVSPVTSDNGTTWQLHREGDEGQALMRNFASASDDLQWRTCPSQQVGDGGTKTTGVTQAGSGANREEVHLF